MLTDKKSGDGRTLVQIAQDAGADKEVIDYLSGQTKSTAKTKKPAEAKVNALYSILATNS